MMRLNRAGPHTRRVERATCIVGVGRSSPKAAMNNVQPAKIFGSEVRKLKPIVIPGKKINNEKKASMAAQFAAEATLRRRVHAAQKDDDMPPIEAILAPLEAELKLARQEIAKLQDDNKALDRLTKSKEAALFEAECTVQVALAKASMVDDLQNKNQELM